MIEVPEHGSRGYRLGCRCDVCRAANARRAREYRARRRNTDTGFLLVSTAPVREHLAMLIDAGIKPPAIAAQANASVSTIRRLLGGQPSYTDPQATITREVANRILAVKLQDCDRGRYVLADAARNWLRDLMLNGWSLEVIGEEIGVNYYVLRRIARGAQLIVWRTIERKIKQFYSNHWNETGPSVKTARAAKQRGFLPAWRTQTPPPDPIATGFQSRETLLRLEYLLEQKIRDWLLGIRKTPAWSMLPMSERKFLEIRFALSGVKMQSVHDFSSNGLTPASIRQRTQRALRSLLMNPAVDVTDSSDVLRIYLTHPLLHRL